MWLCVNCGKDMHGDDAAVLLPACETASGTTGETVLLCSGKMRRTTHHFTVSIVTSLAPVLD